MAFTERLALVIDANGKGAISELKKVGDTANREIGRAESSTRRLSANLVSAGAVAVGAGAAISAGLYQAAQAANSLGDSQDKAMAAFGAGYAAPIEKFASNAFESMGKSKAAAIEAAATYGNIGKSFGLSGKLLIDYGTTLATRTADVAERQKKSYEEVQKAFEGGLRGRGKALLALGIKVDEAAVKEEAYRSGLAKEGTALTSNQKAMAAYQIIMQKTADSAKFYADNNDIGQAADRFKAQMENLKAGLGESILPIVVKITEGVGGWSTSSTNWTRQCRRPSGR